MQFERLVLRKVWRSELFGMILFLGTLIAAPIISSYFPGSVIRGELLRVAGTVYYLRLPLAWLIPATILMTVLWRIYNVCYQIDAKGIEAREGILSLSQSITRIRYEDIRSIETFQTILGRIINVGTVEMGTAATGEVEIRMRGIASPKYFQELIQMRRELVLTQNGDVSAEQRRGGGRRPPDHEKSRAPSTAREAV